MDTRNGKLYMDEQAALEAGVPDEAVVQLPKPPTIRQQRAMQIEPYDPCICGSGAKYKFCCRGKSQKEILERMSKNLKIRHEKVEA